ncbi:hypothetical protein F5Y18DRAFT_246658 [Xylariaceae sp. FL1019]|nr:hypothetical protein F5Y18DRAFT_246658 [Xylariaceae sp. FL1019]
MPSNKKRGSTSSTDSYSDMGSVYSSEATMSSYAPSYASMTSGGSTSTAMHGFGPGQGRQYLPCEFVGYGWCDVTFNLDDTESWIEHIITEHLYDQLPRKAICWFCDEYEFDYKGASARGDRRVNFDNRMHHIREHLLDGWTVDRIRVDHHFNEHLHKADLIPAGAYNSVRRWSELPAGNPPWLYAHNAVPFEVQKREERNQYQRTDTRHEERRQRKEHGKRGKR